MAEFKHLSSKIVYWTISNHEAGALKGSKPPRA